MKATSIKRASQIARVYDIKIVTSKLNEVQKETLRMLFIEKKWLYNHILATDSIFTHDYKDLITNNLDKDGNVVQHELEHLSAKLRCDIIREMQKSIFALSQKKKNGNRVGRLKFRSECCSIELSQFGNSHKIVNKNRIKIVGIKRHLYVRGLAQIPKDVDFANAKLIKRPDGYHLLLTCYRSKEIIEKERREHIKLHTNQKDGGIDLNIKNTVVTSEGKSYFCRVEEPESLKRLQRKFAKQAKHSNSWQKTRQQIQKSYQRTNNRKQDVANKIVHELEHDFDVVYMQDENLSGWQKNWFGNVWEP